MISFTPWSALGGGALIGLAAVSLLWFDGRIAGVSGIAADLWFRPADWLWRVLFLAGLIAGTALWTWYAGRGTGGRTSFPPALLVLAGLLVGYGTALAGGCTSGHGVCGLARLSLRSFIATLVFLSVAMFTTHVVRHVLLVS
jgi:uncharacterized protein